MRPSGASKHPAPLGWFLSPSCASARADLHPGSDSGPGMVSGTGPCFAAVLSGAPGDWPESLAGRTCARDSDASAALSQVHLLV